jgi:hypothetical protein
MIGKVWYVGKKSDNTLAFVLPSDRSVNSDAVIEVAQPFTICLRSFRVANNYSTNRIPFRAKGNDLLVRSTCALGDKPKVERMHFYEDNTRPGEYFSGLEYNVMYVCPDYDGKSRLWLSFEIWEIALQRHLIHSRM